MAKPIIIIVSTFLFTVLGIAAGLVAVLNLPRDLHDPEGMVRIMSALCPAGAGCLLGFAVGMVAASMSSGTGKA